MTEKIRVFDLYWLNKRIERVSGYSISDAMTRAGYGNGALKALDYWKEIMDVDAIENVK